MVISIHKQISVQVLIDRVCECLNKYLGNALCTVILILGFASLCIVVRQPLPQELQDSGQESNPSMEVSPWEFPVLNETSCHACVRFIWDLGPKYQVNRMGKVCHECGCCVSDCVFVCFVCVKNLFSNNKFWSHLAFGKKVQPST